MRRLFLPLILILFLCSYLFAQDGRIIISGDGQRFALTVTAPVLSPKVSRGAAGNELNYAEYTDVFSPGTLKLPFEELIIAIPPNSRPSVSCKIIEQKRKEKSAPALNPETGASNDSTIIETAGVYKGGPLTSPPLCEVKGLFWYRDFYCARVRVRLAEYNYAENAVDEVLKYELQIGAPVLSLHAPIKITTDFDRVLTSLLANASIAEQFRGTPPLSANDTTGTWLVYGQPHLKLGVAEDRIYRIKRTDLEQAGVSLASVNPKQFQLFYRGTEIPLYVSGEEDNSFDANDYVEFFGTRNYNPISPRVINPDSMPYNDYLDKYTDTSYYFLRWGIAQGKRVQSVTANLPGASDSVYYHTALLHNEKNALYQQVSVDVVKNQNTEALDSKAWFSNFVYTSESANSFAGDYRVAFVLSDVVKGRQASLFSRLISAGSNRTENAHTIAVGFKVLPAVSSDTNMFKVEQRSISRNQRVVLGGILPSDSLKNSTNIFIMRNYRNTTTVNYLAFDWFEVEYPRYLVAKNDSLYFDVPDIGARGLRSFAIKGLSAATTAADYVLYQVKPNLKRLTSFTKSGTQITFSDSVGSGDAYYLYPAAKISRPATIKLRHFVNLRDPARKADYLAITHPLLYAKAKEYVGFIKTSYSVDTTVILIEDIYDEFAYGNPDPASFRLFLQMASAAWQNPKPSYLSLIGIACYDYKRNFFRERGYEVNYNLVPSYGEPVSDAWFTMWDDANSGLPQMFTGRIPSKTADQLNFYLDKHRNHLQQKFDDWNKRTLFFSGGDGNDTLQLQTLRTINNIIVENYVKPAPLALSYNHFYKTANPLSDFGPYEPNYVRRAIDNGGLFISYIGHSGTRTWDNSISDPNQLLNKVNKYPLVSDFGCSTNKFAEPDIEAFGALFVNSGQTLAYVGNTSLGFTSTSSSVPVYFYESLLKDGFPTYSVAHLKAKSKMLSTIGTTGTYRVFTLTNALLGDPLAAMQLPPKPNLNLSAAGITFSPASPTDQTDSVKVKIGFQNLGTVSSDSFTVRLEATLPNQSSISKSIKNALPGFSDTLTVTIPVKGMSGIYRVRVILDALNVIDEIYENDNTTETQFNVASLSVRPLLASMLGAFANPVITVLNPSRMTGNPSGELILQVDTSAAFPAPLSRIVKLDTLSTSVTLPPLTENRRYYYRARANTPDTLWSTVYTFFKTAADYSYYLGDAYSFAKQNTSALRFENGLRLTKDTMYLSIKSGGGNFSKYGSILKNSKNLLDNTFGWGMGIAVLDPVTFNVEYAKLIQYGFVSTLQDSLAAIINALPAGKIVLMNVVDDGWVGGALKPVLKNAIKSIGSKEIDNLGGREPWVIFGIKGAAPGSVPEIRKSANYLDILTFDTVVVANISTGFLLTEAIGDVTQWGDIVKSDTVSGDGSIVYKPIGIRADETADTLAPLIFTNGRATLAGLNSTLYRKGKILATLSLSSSGVSPVLRSIGINYSGLPELGMNDQTVLPDNDTLYIGQTANVRVIVKNAGSAKADSFKVYTDIVNPDNTYQRIDSRVITGLQANAKLSYSVPFTVSVGEKNRTFRVTADPENVVREYFKDNNQYVFPFIVSADTSLHPSLRLFADSVEFVEGDFVRPNTLFRMELSDPSLDLITDTTHLTVYLDDRHVFYTERDSLRYQLQPANPKFIALYSPSLTNGEHELRILALSASRRDTLRLARTFKVSASFSVTDIYPYPNPFSGKAHFTFQLSEQADEARIKIYSVAGRLIKVINIPCASLRAGFNSSVSWDGTDEDGDEVANGLYFARIILRKGDKTGTSTVKLVRAR